MIAYNNVWLENIHAQEQLEDALAENLISKAEKDAAAIQFPVEFYSPNIFIRIGLFILTVIVISFSLGLMVLFFQTGNENAFSVLVIFLGLLCYVFLEWIIPTKRHYQSGVDDGLMWSSAVLIVAGIIFAADLSSQSNSLIIFLISAFFTIRFADRVMALFSMIAFLAIVFFIAVKVGGMARVVLPFLLMLLAAAFYTGVKKMQQNKRFINYDPAMVMIETAALACFYFAGNYFVVREAGNKFLGLQLTESESIPFGWIFWLFTVAIPPLYILLGIKKKDIVLIRSGLLLIAAMVFTIRNYYNVIPVETAMLFGGLILVGVSYIITKMLREPRAGFTSLPAVYNNKSVLQNIEAIIIAETLSAQQSAGDDTKFGGGSFGGGGASADY